ncbi:MAG: adenine phosphoribosyltransferase [Cyclobacteriaceae bacterium]
MTTLEQRIKETIRDIPDFPKPGIVFKDITPLLSNVSISSEISSALAEYWNEKEIDVVVGIESRGFMWGHSLALALSIPFVPIRKKGKLPGESFSYEYDLEYGSAEIEIHKGAISAGQRVLIHDDLLATGGTAVGAAELVKLSSGIVSGFSFIVELDFLNGGKKLKQYTDQIHALSVY